jgi:hypothetical protein
MPSASPCSDALSNASAALAGLVEFAAVAAELVALDLIDDFPQMLALLLPLRQAASTFSVQGAAALNNLIACLQSLISTGGAMAVCSPTHSSKVQGAGLCCAAVAAGQLVKPPAGTTLPVYTKGAAATMPVGRITNVTDSGGHCASCMIVGSSSPKHFGKPVLKFIRGGPGCAVAGSGCCAMAA